MILRMDEFDTDYSFLNLPEAGSDVRGPIGLPSISPVSFDLFGGKRPIRRPRPEPIEIQPIRRVERGDDQGRFEMGRAIGQEVNMLRENIQTLEAAKGELASERDAAIQMQDEIRQQMSEQRIQELDQQQAQLQAELQEAVAQAEARGIDAVAEAEAQAAEELASVSADFQSQIDALTGERDQAIAEQDMIRAEAADQQAQALEAQKQDYESQLAALQQAPAETPAVPDIGPIPGFKEQFPYLELLGQEQPQEVKDMVARSMETGEPVISPDQVQDMINRMGGQAGPVKAPQMPPKKNDQLFISDQPKFIEEKVGSPVTLPGVSNFSKTPITPIGKGKPIQKPISIGGVGGGRPVGGPVVRPGPKPVLKPTKDLIAGGFAKSPIKAPPPRMSVGGIGGFAGGRSGRMIRR